MNEYTEYTNLLSEKIVEYGTRLILALVVLLVGWWVIRFVIDRLTKLMNKRGVDASLTPFLRSMMNIGLKAALFVSVAGMVGIEMTSFVAILGAAGLAVGLALQGTLQNFAGGVMILLFKPFKAGDVIEAQGYTGIVKEIQIFNTFLTTPDNKLIIIPNGSLANGSLINYSTMDTRRVDQVFGIGYQDNLQKAREIILRIASDDERVLREPEPFVRLGELGSSSINITVRLWTKTEDYWNVYFDLLERVKIAFDAEGISIPFPQLDVHLPAQELK